MPPLPDINILFSFSCLSGEKWKDRRVLTTLTPAVMI
jgi:hypothetical protein